LSDACLDFRWFYRLPQIQVERKLPGRGFNLHIFGWLRHELASGTCRPD
jgi:hypothetical protein